MGVAEQSHETVESSLSTLEESYESFSVNQTTIPVSPGEYRRERERADAGAVDLYARVENERSEILHVERDGALELPWTRATGGAIESSARETVENETGISCRLEGIEQATILGVHDAETNYEPVYRLAVLFNGVPASGSPNASAVWQPTAELPELIVP